MEAVDLNLGEVLANEGTTRLLQYNDFRFYWEQDATAATTKHNQQTWGTWEGRLREAVQEMGGSRDGRVQEMGHTHFEHRDAPGSKSGRAGGQLQGAGIETAEPEG